MVCIKIPRKVSRHVKGSRILFSGERWKGKFGNYWPIVEEIGTKSIFREVPKEREKKNWYFSKTHSFSFLVTCTTDVSNVNILLFLKRRREICFV